MKRDGTLKSWIPPLRPAPEVLGSTSYKYPTPNGVKPASHSDRQVGPIGFVPTGYGRAIERQWGCVHRWFEEIAPRTVCKGSFPYTPPVGRQKLNLAANCIKRGSPARAVILPTEPLLMFRSGSANCAVLNILNISQRISRLRPSPKELNVRAK